MSNIGMCGFMGDIMTRSNYGDGIKATISKKLQSPVNDSKGFNIAAKYAEIIERMHNFTEYNPGNKNCIFCGIETPTYILVYPHKYAVHAECFNTMYGVSISPFVNIGYY